MSRSFGRRNPLDEASFTTPTGSSCASGPSYANDSKGPVIEELHSDDDENKDKYEDAAWANEDPLVEHPDDDQTQEDKDINHQVDYNQPELTQPQTRKLSFQRVTYGGINGAYYIATTTRRAGNNGVVVEERKQADKTTGEATHRVSRGIHDKGHSFIRKLGSDGQVDTMQTLHNLHEDELSSFEQDWKGNADRHMPRWNDGFDLFTKTGDGDGGKDLKKCSKFALAFREEHNSSGGTRFPFRVNNFGGMGIDQDVQHGSRSGKPRKVVTINIE